mgnify:CR=1 FL=1
MHIQAGGQSKCAVESFVEARLFHVIGSKIMLGFQLRVSMPLKRLDGAAPTNGSRLEPRQISCSRLPNERLSAESRCKQIRLLKDKNTRYCTGHRFEKWGLGSCRFRALHDQVCQS